MVEQDMWSTSFWHCFSTLPPLCFQGASTLSSLKPRFWNEPAVERKRGQAEPKKGLIS